MMIFLQAVLSVAELAGLRTICAKAGLWQKRKQNIMDKRAEMKVFLKVFIVDTSHADFPMYTSQFQMEP